MDTLALAEIYPLVRTSNYLRLHKKLRSGCYPVPIEFVRKMCDRQVIPVFCRLGSSSEANLYGPVRLEKLFYSYGKVTGFRILNLVGPAQDEVMDVYFASYCKSWWLFDETWFKY